jgi:D-alanine-D-alanine ligase
MVKPRHESTSYGLRLVRDRRELDQAVTRVASEYEQEALVEEFIEGREICVGILGNGAAEILPLVELDFSDRDLRALTWEDKYHKRDDEPDKICPANVEPKLAAYLREISLSTFHACQCKDYSRVDIRIDSAGRPFVLEINSMASLGQGGSYVLAARQAGYDFPALVQRILDVAHERYFGKPTATGGAAASSSVKAGCAAESAITTISTPS